MFSECAASLSDLSFKKLKSTSCIKNYGACTNPWASLSVTLYLLAHATRNFVKFLCPSNRSVSEIHNQTKLYGGNEPARECTWYSDQLIQRTFMNGSVIRHEIRKCWYIFSSFRAIRRCLCS